jgi:hypothetical protein
VAVVLLDRPENKAHRIHGAFESIEWMAGETSVWVGRPRPTWSIRLALGIAAYILFAWSILGAPLWLVSIAMLPYAVPISLRILASRQRATLGCGCLALQGPFRNAVVGVHRIERFAVRSRRYGNQITGWRHNLVAILTSKKECRLITLTSVLASTEIDEVEAAFNARLAEEQSAPATLGRCFPPSRAI